MPDHRQKQREKQKKRRAHAGRPGAKATNPMAAAAAEQQIVDRLLSNPPGPAFISRNWQIPSEPRLHCIVASRILDENTLVPVVILVDLGCVGVRDAYLSKPVTPDGLQDLVNRLREMFHRGFEEIPMRRAAAVVRQAVAYAAEIELQPPPHAAPVLALLGEEVEPGFEVELGRRRKRLYSPQPGEDTRPMVKRLVAAVGPDGFEVVLPQREGTAQQ